MAKATSLADSLGKHLECAVCLEQYTDPKVLPCLHSFCKRCLQGLMTCAKVGAPWKINCPSCRFSAEVPQGQIDFLPVNFFVNNLLSMVSLHEDFEAGKLGCDICDSGDPPVNRCATCSHFLCEFCTQGHRRARSTSSHSLVSLEEAKKMGSVAVTKPSLCKEHDGEVMKLFCETCEEAICRDCTIVKHRDHKYTFVKDAFSKGKESLLEFVSETKTKATVLKEAVDGVSEMKRNVHACAVLTVQEVVNCFNELTACLDARRGELIDKVEEFKKAKLKSLEIQQEELETALLSVQSGVEFTERAFENGSEVEILNMRKQMSSRLQDLNSAKWQLEPCVNEGIQFKGDNQLMKHGIVIFGDVTDVATHAGMSTVTMENGQEGVMYNTLCGQPVEFRIIAKEWNGRNRNEGGDSFGVRIDADAFYVNSISTVLKANDCGNGTYSFSHTPEEEGHHLLSVLLNGHHVQGSPFSWCVENWSLVQFSLAGNSSGGEIQLTDENLTAVFVTTGIVVLPRHRAGFGRGTTGIQYGAGVLVPPVRRGGGFAFGCLAPVVNGSSKFNWSIVASSDSQNPSTDRRPFAEGSVGFTAGKHMWKVQLFGNVLQGFCFGIRNRTLSDGTTGQLGNWWVWNSKQVHQLHSQFGRQARRGSTITDCASKDIIELYLDCESGTLVMYNPRTKQSETLDEVKGEVSPVFRMTTNGDKVSLKI